MDAGQWTTDASCVASRRRTPREANRRTHTCTCTEPIPLLPKNDVRVTLAVLMHMGKKIRLKHHVAFLVCSH